MVDFVKFSCVIVNVILHVDASPSVLGILNPGSSNLPSTGDSNITYASSDIPYESNVTVTDSDIGMVTDSSTDVPNDANTGYIHQVV